MNLRRPRCALAAVLVPAVLAVLGMVAAWREIFDPDIAWSSAWTAAALSAMAGMIVARRAAGPAQRSRWTWWTAATACWLAGQVAWDLYPLTGTPPSPHVADLGWWAFAVLVVGGLLRTHERSRSVRVVALVEVLPLIAAVMALTFAQLWDDAAGSGLPLSARASALAYPFVYVSAAVITLQAMVGGSLRRVRGAGPLAVLAGIVAQSVAFVLWSDELLAASASHTSLADALWAGGMLAIGAGGALAARRPEAADDAAADSEHAARGGLLPGAVFVLLVAALMWAGFVEPPLGARLMLAMGLLTCGVTLIARSGLLGRRLRILLDRERLARTELAVREAELAELNAQLRRDVRNDPLTGLRNRRALAEDLPVLEESARRHGESFAVALCDADRFKAYNDQLGHLAGDEALRLLANAVRGVLRKGDAAYRYGGEELLLLLRNAGPDEALVTAERVRVAVEEVALPHPADPSGRLTVSVGVAAGTVDGATLLGRADEALYRAKRGGRNRVMAATGALAPGAGGAERERPVDDPLLRQIRSMLAVARAAAAGQGARPVLEALARTLRSELRFQTVAVNLREGGGDDVRVVLVEGAEEVRAALLGTVAPWAAWAPLLEPRFERCGAAWVPAGSYEDDDGLATWVPARGPILDAAGWDPDDLLLLPLRGAAGDVLGIVSVDEPLSGRRPDDAELRLLMAVADHAGLALEQAERLGSLPAHRLAAVMLLAETLDLRDAGTAEHSRTVGAYARQTAATLGLAPERVERLHAAGVLHDLGKLGIVDAILHKPAALDEAEWREMRRHPEVGARILEHAGVDDIAGWVRAHHERIDGRGYPDGLRAAGIPLEARILAVADAYEAMVADRPYRRGLEPGAARAELLRGAGTQFDADVVDAFLRTLDDAAVVPLAAPEAVAG